jgi:hypothetical protein
MPPARFLVAATALVAVTALTCTRNASADVPCRTTSASIGLRFTTTSDDAFSDAFHRLSFLPRCDDIARLRIDGATVSTSDTPRPEAAAQTAQPIAFMYSDAYQARARWHKRASFGMIPLFTAEAILGQSMFNHPSDISSGKQQAHKYVGIGIGTLFGVNTVTGVWNMIEGRKDPNGIVRRTIHGTLMLVADAGFFATSLTRPNTHDAEGLLIYDAKKNQHMTVAYSSIAVAGVGYLIMLLH